MAGVPGHACSITAVCLKRGCRRSMIAGFVCWQCFCCILFPCLKETSSQGAQPDCCAAANKQATLVSQCRLAKLQSSGQAMSPHFSPWQHCKWADCRQGQPAPTLQAAMLMAEFACSTAQQENSWESYIDRSLLWGLPGRDKSGPGLHAPVASCSATKELLPEPFLSLCEAPECP